MVYFLRKLVILVILLTSFTSSYAINNDEYDLDCIEKKYIKYYKAKSKLMSKVYDLTILNHPSLTQQAENIMFRFELSKGKRINTFNYLLRNDPGKLRLETNVGDWIYLPVEEWQAIEKYTNKEFKIPEEMAIQMVIKRKMPGYKERKKERDKMKKSFDYNKYIAEFQMVNIALFNEKCIASDIRLNR